MRSILKGLSLTFGSNSYLDQDRWVLDLSVLREHERLAEDDRERVVAFERSEQSTIVRLRRPVLHDARVVLTGMLAAE